MAGRRSGRRAGTIDLAIFADAFLRLAGAIVLDTLAFAVWNIGTRAPLALVRDVRRSLGDARAMFFGLLSALVGTIFVAAATVLVLPAIWDTSTDFVPAELFTLLVALALEHLIGNDLRALATRR